MENTICFTNTLHSSFILPVIMPITRGHTSEWKSKWHRKCFPGNIPGNGRTWEAFKREKFISYRTHLLVEETNSKQKKRQNIYAIMWENFTFSPMPHLSMTWRSLLTPQWLEQWLPENNVSRLWNLQEDQLGDRRDTWNLGEIRNHTDLQISVALSPHD